MALTPEEREEIKRRYKALTPDQRLSFQEKIKTKFSSQQEPSLSDLESQIGQNYQAMQEEQERNKAFEQSQAQKPSVTESMFPSLSQRVEEGKTETKNVPMNVLSGISDLTSIPTRGLATLRGQKFSDPDANILRPEIEKAKEATPDWANIPVEILGSILGDPTTFTGLGATKAVRGAVKGAGKGINRFAGATAENFSGVSEDALRAYGKGGKTRDLIKAEAGNKELLQDEILNSLEQTAKSQVERGIVKEALEQMPNVNLNSVTKKLEDAIIQNPIGNEKQFNANLKELVSDFKRIGKNGEISPTEYYNKRKSLDRHIQDWDKDFGDISYNNKALMEVRDVMKNELVQSATKSNNPQYINAMNEWHKNIEKAEELKGYLGKTDATREKRIEGFISNLTNKNKTDAQKKLEALNPELLDRAKASSYADRLGMSELNQTPALWSRHMTGKSLAGLQALAPFLAGSAGANPLLAAAGLPISAMSSPRVASKVLGKMDKIGDVVKNINPKFLDMIRNISLSTAGTQGGLSPVFNKNPNERK